MIKLIILLVIITICKALKNTNVRSFFATTVPGLESILLKEIKRIGTGKGVSNVQKGRAGVYFDCDNDIVPIEMTLWLRTSLKMMEKVCSGKNIHRKRDLYDLIYSYDWTKIIDDKHTIKCDCIIGDSVSNELNHSHFTSLTVKNAIVDQLREKLGSRPSISVDNPDLVVLVYIHKDEVICYRVWSGNESMHKRGYRQDAIHKAALRETTAAALLLATEFDGSNKEVIIDPMCGSGTILLEASLILANTAPGLLYMGHSSAEISPNYAPPKYMTWLDNVDKIDLWDEIWENTTALDRRKELNDIGQKLLFGNDIHGGAVELASSSSKKLGVSNIIEWSNRDVSSYSPTMADKIITNPPWNMRLNEGTEEAWSKLGSFLLNCPNKDNIWTLTANPEFVISLKNQGLEPYGTIPFSSSGTPLRFVKYKKSLL